MALDDPPAFPWLYWLFHPEDRIPLSGRIPFDQSFVTETLGDFKISYRITGHIRIDKSEGVTPIKILRKKDRHEAIEYVNSYYIEIALAEYFFQWGWAVRPRDGVSIPWPYLFHVTFGREACNIEIDTGERKLARAISPTIDLARKNSLLSGLLVDIESFQINPPRPQLVEENFQMIRPSILRDIDNDLDYRSFAEQSAIAALKKLADIDQSIAAIQLNQKHAHHFATITAEGVARRVKIAWKFTANGARYVKIQCRRRDRGFSPQYKTPADDEVLIADSSVDGNVVEYLEEDRSYYYTVLFCRADDTIRDYLRFVIQTSKTQPALDMLNKIIAKAQTSIPPVKTGDPDIEWRQKLFDQVARDVGTRAAIEQNRADHIKSTRQLPQFHAASEAVQNSWLDFIERRYEAMIESLEQGIPLRS